MAKKSKIAEAHFHDEDAARRWFEAARWPNGPVCPHCGSDRNYETKKAGRYRCANKFCRKDFTVQTGSVMERSHAPLTHWAYAFTVAADGKKGFSAHQLMRQLGCQYNTAWFLHHRVMDSRTATSSRRAIISSRAIPLRTISSPSRASRSWPPTW